MNDMQISYQTNRLPEKNQFYDLFLTTGWNEKYQLNKERLFEAVQSSWYMISAYDGNKLIGFGRIISDGILHALIVDMIILPEYQGQGIGSILLKKLVDRCNANHIKDIQLFCAKGKTGFYKKFNFEERPVDAPGMQFKF